MSNQPTQPGKLPEEVILQIATNSFKKFEMLSRAKAAAAIANYQDGAVEWAKKWWEVKQCLDAQDANVEILLKKSNRLQEENEKFHSDLRELEMANNGLRAAYDGVGSKNQLLQQENEKLKAALEQFIKRHEGGLLPCRFTYEEGVKALALGGKEGTDMVVEYMPIHPQDAQKFDCPTQYPMHLLNEERAKRNHGQSLQMLKERGGLGVLEILAIVNDKPWSYYRDLKWSEALLMLNEILVNKSKR